MVSSALGNALGLTTETEWDDMVRSFLNVNDYSNTIQYASTDTTNTTKSAYRINGSYIDIIPAIGYWGNWNWDKSCIKIPLISKLTIVYNADRSGGSGATTTGSYNASVGTYIAFGCFTSTNSSTYSITAIGSTSVNNSYGKVRVSIFNVNNPSTIGFRFYSYSYFNAYCVIARVN